MESCEKCGLTLLASELAVSKKFRILSEYVEFIIIILISIIHNYMEVCFGKWVSKLVAYVRGYLREGDRVLGSEVFK